VEDFGAVSMGRDADGFPERDPDEYQPRHGSFADLGGPAAPPPPLPPPPLPPLPLPPRPRSYDDELTEVLPAVTLAGDRPPALATAGGGGRTALRTAGEALITLGMVVLLFVVYELYITNIFAAQKQASATTSLNQEWDTVFNGANGANQRTTHYDLTDGHGIAKLYIPSFGQDYVFTIVEGTTQDDLAIGPGHYVGSGLPGQPGNFAVAGHRVGEGAPFDDLGLVQSCDSILIETETDWYVYRMLPLPGEAADWATGKGKTAQCSGPNGEAPVKPLGGMYAQTVGREIVLPSEGDVVAPIPHHYGEQVSAGQEASLLTLTTCNPKFSAAQRMILHAVLVKDWKKTPGAAKMPPEMKETS
jgi:sortase A